MFELKYFSSLFYQGFTVVCMSYIQPGLSNMSILDSYLAVVLISTQ